MVRTKVFVGNLSFKIKENELVETFSAAGKVAGANIITRGNRSLGYGFVEMESEEEAKKAVELYNQKEIDGRPIKVEVAKPREEGAADQQGQGQGQGPRKPRNNAPRRPRKPRAPGQQGQGQGQQGQQQGQQGGQQGGQGQQQGQRAPRQRRPRQPRNNNNNNAPGSNGSNQQGQGQGQQGTVDGERRPRQPRKPRAPRPDQGPRNPSTTTLFVANLPFAVTDAELAAMFAGIPQKNAHVVMKRNGRSKGFGFVEFNTESDQKAGLALVDQKEVDGRKLIVKVALTENTAAGSSNNTTNNTTTTTTTEQK